MEPMKQIALAAVALFSSSILVGCATQAPAQNYRPAGSNDAAWQIDGTLTGNKIDIRINGESALAGTLSFLGGNAEISGKYKEKTVSASCSTSQGLFTGPKRQCIVFVANERAATLQF